jgi:hypothetical protein
MILNHLIRAMSFKSNKEKGITDYKNTTIKQTLQVT